MTIEEKLNSIRETKEAIKTSIQNKGVEVSDTDPFAVYPEKIDSIETGGGDISEYFNTEPTNITNDYLQNEQWVAKNFFKKLPTIIIPDDITTLRSLFYNYTMPVVPKLKFNSNVRILSYLHTRHGISNPTLYSPKCETIDVSEWDTSNVTDMTSMFAYCTKLKDIIGLNDLDTSNVIYMENMFGNCQSLTSLKLTFDTHNVKKFGSFGSCTSLETLDLAELDLNNVESLASMVHGCSKLTNLSVNWSQLSNVTSITQFLYGANLLTTIDMSEWNMEKVITIGWAAFNATGLENFKLGYNLGKGYLTTASANYGNYTVQFDYATKLTHESLMSIINNLYDIASAGVQTQKLVLGATNIAKLTEEEMAIATAKGWTIS